ncbi:MAG: hypothetical protein HFK08_04880 [Clostridia bacterium]|nr:hypothetical protein [Clostridia bacterium]
MDKNFAVKGETLTITITITNNDNVDINDIFFTEQNARNPFCDAELHRERPCKRQREILRKHRRPFIRCRFRQNKRRQKRG